MLNYLENMAQMSVLLTENRIELCEINTNICIAPHIVRNSPLKRSDVITQFSHCKHTTCLYP